MRQFDLEYVSNPEDWNSHFSNGIHFLQSYAWGQVKKSKGSAPLYVLCRQGGDVKAAALLLVKKVGPFKVGYVPRGPIVIDKLTGAAEHLDFLEQLMRENKLHIVQVDPDAFIDTPEGDNWIGLIQGRKNIRLTRQVQSRGTAVTDLQLVPDILEEMDKSTRYNIRKGAKYGLRYEILPATVDLMESFYDIYITTGGRKGFDVYSKSYYIKLVTEMISDPQVSPYFGIAKHPDVDAPLSMAFLLLSGERAFYFYAASTDSMKKSMPNYGLQWHCLNWAKDKGAASYDWWGAPFDKNNRKDPMYGVWHFKKSFKPVHRQLVGNHILIANGLTPIIAYILIDLRNFLLNFKNKVKHVLRK